MNIVVVTSVSALAVAVVHSVAFAIGRRIGRYNVVDVVWGLGFVAVAVAAATLGHGDPVRRWLLLALVSTWGLRLSWHMYRKTAGQGEDPRYADLLRGATPVQALRKVFGLQGLLTLFVSFPLQLSAVTGPTPKPLLAVGGRGLSRVAGRYHLRSGGRLATVGIQIRPGQSRGHHGPRPVGLDASPQLLRRCLCLVGVVVDHDQRLGAAGHGGFAAADDLPAGGRQRSPAD